MPQGPLVAGIGHANVDFLGIVPRYPDSDSKTELLEVSIQGGGPAATACATAVALGCRARFATKLADDDFGRFILQGLREAGVDCDHVLTTQGRLSPFSFIAVEDESALRTIFYTHGDAGSLLPEELDLARFLEGSAALLVDGHHPAVQIAAAEEARDKNIPVILDAGSLREGMGELVALSDVLIAAERFVSEVAPRGEAEDSLVELQKMGPRRVVITLGEAGSIGLDGDQLVRQQAFEIAAIDTTGAGDVFHGAFAAGVARSQSFERCMQLASATAALKCRALGGRAGIPEVEEVLGLLGWKDLEPEG